MTQETRSNNLQHYGLLSPRAAICWHIFFRQLPAFMCHELNIEAAAVREERADQLLSIQVIITASR